MTKYTHTPGRESATPFMFPWPAFGKTEMRFSFMFTEESLYRIDGPDQDDWLKMTGQDYTPITPANKGWANICAWRAQWAGDVGRIEVGLYTHSMSDANHPVIKFVPKLGVPYDGILRVEAGVSSLHLDEASEAEYQRLGVPYNGILRLEAGVFSLHLKEVAEDDYQRIEGKPGITRVRFSRLIRPWFGGTSLPPYPVSFYLDV